MEEGRLALKKITEQKNPGSKNKHYIPDIPDIPELQQKNEELRSKSKELSVLYKIARILGSQIDVDEALNEALSFIKQVLPINYFLYLSFHSEVRELHLEFAQGVTHKTLKKLNLCKIHCYAGVFFLLKL